MSFCNFVSAPGANQGKYGNVSWNRLLIASLKNPLEKPYHKKKVFTSQPEIDIAKQSFVKYNHGWVGVGIRPLVHPLVGQSVGL